MPIDTSGWERKATEISERIQQQNTPFKTILDPHYEAPASTVFQHYARAGDSAIWTGHYLAAEAFRYKVTASNSALENLQRTLEGLQSLVDITGTGLLARCLFPEDWEFAAAAIKEECRHGIRPGIVRGEKYLWVGNTSRDQYSGVFFGLGAAYDLVDNEAFRSAIRTLVTQLLEFLLKHLWTVVMPGGALTECPGRPISTTFIGRPEQQLNFLQIGRHVNPERFTGEYKKFRSLSRNCRWRHSIRTVLTLSSIWRRSICLTWFALRRLVPAICGTTATPMAFCAMPCVTTGMHIST